MARKTEKGGKFRNVHCRTWNMARPLKRYLQKNVETLAARLMLEGGAGAQDTIVMDVVDGKLKAYASSVRGKA